MLFDVVQEVQAQVETLVPSKPKRVEGDGEEQILGLNSLTDDSNERLAKLEQHAPNSVLESGVTRYGSVLNEWTCTASATIIYDSTVDEFTSECLFRAVKGKPNIAIVATTTDGDVFGGFYSVAVTRQDGWFYDPCMFIFSFESHGRCMTPQRFALKEERKKKVFVQFCKNDRWGFVFCGVYGCGGFYLGNESSESYCWNVSCAFEGLEDTTLTDQNNTNYNFPPYHHCTRLVAIQLE